MMRRGVAITERTLRRQARGAAAMLGLALLAGCGSVSTSPAEAVSERWAYVGEQRVPQSLQLDGVLTVTRVAGDRFEGALDLRRTDALGQAERFAGLAVGRRTVATMDFEVTLAGDLLRHVGRIDGDTIRGTWIDDGTLGAAIRTGPFQLVRVP